MANLESKTTNDYLTQIDNFVKEMKYGNIILIIQDGKVIQIDKTEKIRLKN